MFQIPNKNHRANTQCSKLCKITHRATPNVLIYAKQPTAPMARYERGQLRCDRSALQPRCAATAAHCDRTAAHCDRGIAHYDRDALHCDRTATHCDRDALRPRCGALRAQRAQRFIMHSICICLTVKNHLKTTDDDKAPNPNVPNSSQKLSCEHPMFLFMQNNSPHQPQCSNLCKTTHCANGELQAQRARRFIVHSRCICLTLKNHLIQCIHDSLCTRDAFASL
jgi:hypothetical protein